MKVSTTPRPKLEISNSEVFLCFHSWCCLSYLETNRLFTLRMNSMFVTNLSIPIYHRLLKFTVLYAMVFRTSCVLTGLQLEYSQIINSFCDKKFLAVTSLRPLIGVFTQFFIRTHCLWLRCRK